MPTSLIPAGTRERRIFKVDRIELRAGENGARTLAGHAAVFNSDSYEMYGFTERIKPGCFSRAIKEDDVRGLFNHNPDFVLGRNTAKTLRLVEDDKGLAFEIDLNPKDPDADRVAAKVERGDVTGCSFSFRTIKDEWEYSEDGRTALRTLTEVELFDVGPVTFPAYPETDVSVRSIESIAADGKKILEARKAAADTVPLSLRQRQLELASAE